MIQIRRAIFRLSRSFGRTRKKIVPKENKNSLSAAVQWSHPLHPEEIPNGLSSFDDGHLTALRLLVADIGQIYPPQMLSKKLKSLSKSVTFLIKV